MIGMVYAISRTIRGIMGGARRSVNGRPGGAQKRTSTASQGQMVRDPMCGMFVSTEVSHRLVEGGNVLHFCSESCKESYEKRTAKV